LDSVRIWIKLIRFWIKLNFAVQTRVSSLLIKTDKKVKESQNITSKASLVAFLKPETKLGTKLRTDKLFCTRVVNVSTTKY